LIICYLNRIVKCPKNIWLTFHSTFLSIFSFFTLSNWLSYHVWAASSRGVSEIGSMMAAQRYNCVKIGSHLTLHDLGCHTTTMFATPQGVNYCDRTSSWEMMPPHNTSFEELAYGNVWLGSDTFGYFWMSLDKFEQVQISLEKFV
jgi:hypothetical protein